MDDDFVLQDWVRTRQPTHARHALPRTERNHSHNSNTAGSFGSMGDEVNSFASTRFWELPSQWYPSNFDEHTQPFRTSVSPGLSQYEANPTYPRQLPLRSTTQQQSQQIPEPRQKRQQLQQPEDHRSPHQHVQLHPKPLRAAPQFGTMGSTRSAMNLLPANPSAEAAHPQQSSPPREHRLSDSDSDVDGAINALTVGLKAMMFGAHDCKKRKASKSANASKESRNFETVVAALECFMNLDIPGFIKCLHPNVHGVRWDGFLQRSSFHGIADYLRVEAEFAHSIPSYCDVKAEGMIARGDKVMFQIRIKLSAIEASPEFDLVVDEEWTLEDGKVVECNNVPRNSAAVKFVQRTYSASLRMHQKECRDWFQRLDTKSDGVLDSDELRPFLQNIADKRLTAQALLRQFGDGKSYLEFPDFLRLFVFVKQQQIISSTTGRNPTSASKRTKGSLSVRGAQPMQLPVAPRPSAHYHRLDPALPSQTVQWGGAHSSSVAFSDSDQLADIHRRNALPHWMHTTPRAVGSPRFVNSAAMDEYDVSSLAGALDADEMWSRPQAGVQFDDPDPWPRTMSDQHNIPPANASSLPRASTSSAPAVSQSKQRAAKSSRGKKKNTDNKNKGKPPKAPRIPVAWERKFQLLLKFKAEFGHVRVPQSLNSEQYPGLGVWVNNKRAAYRNEQLRAAGQKPKSTARINAEQIKRLESIGFQWSRSISEAAWETKFQSLKKYVQEKGHARVPASLNTDEYPRLGKWVVNQRQAYRFEKLRESGAAPRRRANRINPQQIRRLEEIGFEWSIGQGNNHGGIRRIKPRAKRKTAEKNVTPKPIA